MGLKRTLDYSHNEIVEEFLNGCNLISGNSHTVRSIAALYGISKTNAHNILCNRYNTLTVSQQQACAERLNENKQVRAERAGRATAEMYAAKRKIYNMRDTAISFLVMNTSLCKFAKRIDVKESTLNRWFHVYLDKNDPLYALVEARLQNNRRNHLQS